ncbi:MAG TPA: response regulator [Burkholderiales bacterium]|nr:response regulator [Burkholderiales bacterium]
MAAEGKRVYMLTAKGNAELTGANSSLTVDDLKLLILVDGIANVEQIAQRAGEQATVSGLAQQLASLARSGHLADPDASVAIDVKDFFKNIDSTVERLQQKGFVVRIAKRLPAKSKLAERKQKTVLLVEDDEQLARIVHMYLQMEDFAVRIAAKRDDINKALREPPKPDLVLLDVQLPDADGFQILEKMRAHPFVKDVPIIMATAKATRESVLQGLRLGCDGYVTKPYDVAVLMSTIKTVLGLK